MKLDLFYLWVVTSLGNHRLSRINLEYLDDGHVVINIVISWSFAQGVGDKHVLVDGATSLHRKVTSLRRYQTTHY